jgi:hypothetical protein
LHAAHLLLLFMPAGLRVAAQGGHAEGGTSA